MMRSAGIWIVALGVSTAAHVTAAYGLYLVTRPDDTPTQQMPETELQLAAYQVQRSEARETQPDADQAMSGDTSGASLDQGAIATSRADALEPNAPTTEAVQPNSSAVAASEAKGAPAPFLSTQSANLAAEDLAQSDVPIVDVPAETAVLAQPDTQTLSEAAILAEVQTTAALPAAEPIDAALPNAEPIGAALPTTEPIGAALPTVEPIGAARPTVEPIGAARIDAQSLQSNSVRLAASAPIPAATPAALKSSAAPLSSNAAPQLQAEGQNAPETSPDQVPVAQSQVPREQAAPVTPPADRAKAAFAFAGSGEDTVDPVSLSAFQSFMEPGDLSGAAAEVRDGITGILSAIPCSRLQVEFDPDENTLVVSGHVPETALRGNVVAAMQAQMGNDIPVRDNLLILPRPQCGALSGIAGVGLPQSTDQITNPMLIGEDTHAREFRYTEGNPLVMTLQGADYDAFVYVDYFDADGNVLHLMPNEFTPMTRTRAKTALQIGSNSVLPAGEPGLYIEIGPPFGQEIAVAFAASEPLYEGVRPLVEAAEPYLAWLQEQVRAARENNPDFKGEWVYFFVSTAPD